MSGQREGFDAPVESAEDDLLGRWGFAHEIFTLATQCPDDWSVRIGVYGDWGTGKTSVLKFVERMAYGKGHTVMWFNPWGVKNPDSLWRNFIKEVVDAIQPSAFAPDVSSIKRSETARKAAEVFLGIGKLFSETEKLSDAGKGLVTNWLKAGPEDLKKISDHFRDHRLIVLIDDLDRADPSVVPDILFTLKEIFDLPGFSFVMGFDRQRVGAALASYHPGWGRGIEFLDKVVDFPRWLPAPSAALMKRLALRDLQRYAPFVDLEAYNQVEEHAPANPRELRKFARGLTSFGKEVKRYGKGEIDWPLFLLLSFFRARWPMAFEATFQLPALEQLALNAYPIFGRDSDFGRDSEEKAKSAEAAFEAHLRSVGLSESAEIAKARALLEDIFRKAWLSLSPRKIFEMAFLLEFPKLVTQEELGRFIEDWQKSKSPDMIKAWIQQHATNTQRQEQLVHASLFEMVLETRDTVLHSAASAVSSEKTLEQGTLALELLELLGQLAVDLGGLVRPPHALELGHFKSLLGQITHWAHFRNHKIYLKLREEEIRLLSRIAETTTIDIAELFAAIGDIDPFMALGEAPVKEIRDIILNILAPRVAGGLINTFRQQHAIDTIVHGEKHLAIKRLLLDAKGAFWSGPQRKLFSEMASQAAEASVIHENFFSFARALKGDLERGQGKALSSDGEALALIWKGASARAVNPRMFTALQDVKEQFESSTGIKLQLPLWWPESSPAPNAGRSDDSPPRPHGTS